MIQVYLSKRYLRSRRNGKREYRWALRWEGPDGWRFENTGTADRNQAEALRKQKWAELNIPGCEPDPEPAPEPSPEPVKATWDECKDALKQAMEGDNLRPSYIKEALLTFDGFRETFPQAETPADVTPAMAQAYKQQRMKAKVSPWTVKGNLAILKAAFGKRLTKELGLIPSNPFANVTPPKCDDPEVRIVSPDERKALVEWLSKRWNNWKLPLTYLEVLAATGWRATETAALREKDLLGDGHVRVIAENCKTRRHKYGWLHSALYADLQECAAAGWAFGRFSDQLRRLLLLWKRRPSHAARVKDFQPKRLVQWFQDELVHFREGQEGNDHFTLHDFRRTTITDLQMAGVSEKETSLMVGATPEVIRKHYEKLEAMTIAKRAAQKRLSANHQSPAFVAPVARAAAKGLDGENCVAQTSVG